jgi:4a-hydroxytetrahydrobiopterin dehydratase
MGGKDMLRSARIAEAGLTDWRKLAQGLHARFRTDGFAAGARFAVAVGDAGDEVGHHPRVVIGAAHVDLELVTPDAIYRADDGTEHVVEWVTQQDVDLARRISGIAADLGLEADPAAVAEVELGLDTTRPGTLAPVWAALLTGEADSQGRGSPSDEVRDATARVPNLWFDDGDASGPQRLHVEVYLAPEVAAQRVAAAVAAGGTVVDDSQAPGLVVVADQDGNTGIVCCDPDAAGQG